MDFIYSQYLAYCYRNKFAYSTIFVLLILTRFSASGQKLYTSGSVINENDLINRTFISADKKKSSKSENDLDLFYIFQKDRRAIFRAKRGKLVKDSPLNWRFEADSLCLQPSPILMEVDGQIHQIERIPIKYAIEKVSGGYLLKEKDNQILLMEIK
ncbi:MAG: hypothetical protein EOO07_33330 [Chitinophagaceae bacterium]|nr:MAG: hypothetical protein EOO07_33330 [Chitinophagaceae bacterium]